jgi:hypothetical protein
LEAQAVDMSEDVLFEESASQKDTKPPPSN